MAGRGRKRFYVYRIFDDPAVTLYVGKGSGRRLADQKRKFRADGEVLKEFTVEDEAFAYEREMIALLMPEFNRCPGGNGGRAGPVPLVPREYRGKVTEAQMRRLNAEWRKEYALIDRIGTRAYAARILMAVYRKAPHLIDASKVDVIRQVAYGCGV